MCVLRHLTFTALLSLSATTIDATPYDGLYRPANDDHWTCNPDRIGEERQAVAIEGDKLFGVENTCTLSGATPVRDMNAVLYDAKCEAEGATYIYRLMLMHHANGVWVIDDGFASEWISCP